ncbi:MAG: HRDC domain-containing protein, partial [Vibrio gallaecicus]
MTHPLLKNVQFQVFDSNTPTKQGPKDVGNLFNNLKSLDQAILAKQAAEIEKKEKQKELLLYAGIGGFSLLTLGIVLYVKKKKKLSSKRDPILALKLRELRDEIRLAENIPAFQIFTQETLYALCDALPKSTKELGKVKGMGKIRVKKYGEEILAVIKKYCESNGINDQNSKKKEVKKHTKQITLELFTAGLSIKEIAKERSLTINTIQSH